MGAELELGGCADIFSAGGAADVLDSFVASNGMVKLMILARSLTDGPVPDRPFPPS